MGKGERTIEDHPGKPAILGGGEVDIGDSCRAGDMEEAAFAKGDGGG